RAQGALGHAVRPLPRRPEPPSRRVRGARAPRAGVPGAGGHAGAGGVVSAVRKRVVVNGRVQGVFFRDSTRRRASTRGVAGWVSNRSDGAVEAVFEGEPDAVDSLVDYAR